MRREVPDTRLMKQASAFRAKYRTKREGLAGGMLNCYAWQIIAHPQNMGPEPRRSSRTKALAEDILSNGYDPSEATVDSVVVEAAVDGTGAPMKTFAEHFLANAFFDPDHYNDPDAVIGRAGLSHNSLNLTERRTAGMLTPPPRGSIGGKQGRNNPRECSRGPWQYRGRRCKHVWPR